MAGPTVVMPSLPPPGPSPVPLSSPSTGYQGRFPQPRAPGPSDQGGHAQQHYRSQPFRSRFPPNKGQDDALSGIMYDGKRMRKAIHRKTVDYNPSILNYLRNRVWQRDRRDATQIQPDSLYAVDLVPPIALPERPMNAVSTRFVRTSTNKFRCPIFCLTWTPEGRRLVTGASSGEFTLWNGLTFNFETILQAHETAVRAMRWSHSDSWMVTADHAGYIKYWQSNMNNVKMYPGHKEPIRGISFCCSDSKFASCSDDGTVRVWDFMRCYEERILRGHGADVRCVDWHPQKALLASGSKDNQQPVKLWDPRTGNSLATLHAHKHTVMDLKWHKNGNWMLTASRDHLLKLFDIRNFKEEMQTFKGHKREATAIGWHPVHEGLFVSGSADGALMFWMVGCDHEVGGIEEAHEGMVWSVGWHPLGHILASGSNDHATKFWTRNRPGDEMRDKYNLNNLPAGLIEQEMLEYSQESSSAPNLPGMGLEHGLPEHLQVKEEVEENALPAIPGLDWEEDSAFLKAEQDKLTQKKVPYARPVPKMFEAAWSGEIDMEAIKKEQQEKEKQKAAAKFIGNNPTLMLQQMLGAAIAGTLRQSLAAGKGGRMILPGAPPIMLGPGGPQVVFAPGQPVMGSTPGQMMLIPGGGPRPPNKGPGQMQQQQQQQQQQQIPQQTGNANNGANNTMNMGGAGGGGPMNNSNPSQQGGQQAPLLGLGPRPVGPDVNLQRPQGQPGQGQPGQGQPGQAQGLQQPPMTSGPQSQMPPPQNTMGHNQSPMGGPSMGPGPHMGPRPPRPAFQGPPPGQFPPRPPVNRGNPSEMDRDERFSGQGPPKMSGPPGAPTDSDLDQDFRSHVYNGPLLSQTMEDSQAPVSAPGRGRRTLLAAPPQRISQDYQGEENADVDFRIQGGDGYQNDGGDYGEDYGDYDERTADRGDYNHPMRSRDRGRGFIQHGGSGEGHRGRGRGGMGKDYQGGYEDEGWGGGGDGYEESYDYEDTDERGHGGGRKRAWEDGPGKARGRGRGSGWSGRREHDGGRGRGSERGMRWRGGGYRGGRGWDRGGPPGERGGRGRSRGGHHGGIEEY